MLQHRDIDYYADDENIGYYRFVGFRDMINNYMSGYVGSGNLVQNVNQHNVEFHMKRAIQEFSYDLFRPVLGWEEMLENDALSMRVPQNLVDIVNVYWVDDAGYKHVIPKQRYSDEYLQALKDEDGNLTYDSDGELLYANESGTLRAFQADVRGNAEDAFYNYYAGSFENDELYDRYYSYYGRRYGAEPEQSNLNGSYVFDREMGVIFFDATVRGRPIVLDYISDGLATDVNEIRVHKFAEEAVYTYVTWKLVKNMREMPLYEKQLTEKEHRAAKRRAKLRLSPLSPEELSPVLRQKHKWIKH